MSLFILIRAGFDDFRQAHFQTSWHSVSNIKHNAASFEPILWYNLHHLLVIISYYYKMTGPSTSNMCVCLSCGKHHVRTWHNGHTWFLLFFANRTSNINNKKASQQQHTQKSEEETVWYGCKCLVLLPQPCYLQQCAPTVSLLRVLAILSWHLFCRFLHHQRHHTFTALR